MRKGHTTTWPTLLPLTVHCSLSPTAQKLTDLVSRTFPMGCAERALCLWLCASFLSELPILDCDVSQDLNVRTIHLCVVLGVVLAFWQGGWVSCHFQSLPSSKLYD